MISVQSSHLFDQQEIESPYRRGSKPEMCCDSEKPVMNRTKSPVLRSRTARYGAFVGQRFHSL